MEYYAGLDVSLEETAICIVNEVSGIVREARVASEPEALIKFFGACGIAQIMRTGWYRAVHVKNPACRSWRALLTARRMVLNKRRDVENGIRAPLREVGFKIGTPSRRNVSIRSEPPAAR
jgi:transposase